MPTGLGASFRHFPPCLQADDRVGSLALSAAMPLLPARPGILPLPRSSLPCPTSHLLLFRGSGACSDPCSGHLAVALCLVLGFAEDPGTQQRPPLLHGRGAQM